MRFILRDLLWLTALSAVAISWFIDRGSIKTAQAQLDKDRETVRIELAEAKKERENMRQLSQMYSALSARLDELFKPVARAPGKNDL